MPNSWNKSKACDRSSKHSCNWAILSRSVVDSYTMEKNGPCVKKSIVCSIGTKQLGVIHITNLPLDPNRENFFNLDDVTGSPQHVVGEK